MDQPADETALIRQAQDGDRGAFESLLGRHYDAIYRMAYRRCGNREDAEDITQNACIKLARAIEGFRFESAFLTWLYPLVINTARDWMRSRARHATEPVSDAGCARAEAPAGEERVYAGEVMAHVRRLPEREREALLLVFIEGLTHRETAAVMACKESTVSWYIHEARKKLQSLQPMERRHG